MKNKKIIFRIVLIFIFGILFGIELFLYADFLNDNLNTQIESLLDEISKQGVTIVKKEIDGQFDILTEIANRMGYADGKDDEKILKEAKQKYNFRNMAVVDRNFTMYLNNGSKFNIKERMDNAVGKGKGRQGDNQIINPTVLERVFNGEKIITEPVIDINTNDEIIFYGVPIYNSSGEIDEILIAIYGMDVLRELIEVSSFNNQGYSYIVKNNGDMVIRSSNESSINTSDNILEFLLKADSENEISVNELSKLMAENKNGYIKFKNDIYKYMSCTPIGIKDWYLLNVVPENVMNKIASSIMRSTYVLCSSIILLMGILIFFFIFAEKKKYKELNAILYVDPLTGGYSFAKFELEAKKLLENSNYKSAVVVMDIDEFKLINELLGYNVGDEALVDIWNFFKDKIGYEEIYARSEGDKFVFLLHYDTDAEIQARLTGIIEELKALKNKSDYVLKPLFGIYKISEGDNITIKQMYNYALIAISDLRETGGKECAFFTEELSEHVKLVKSMEKRIEEAYDNEEFIVYYQPKYDALTKRMVGAEALIRWKLPDGSLIPPYKFIPIAENNGFIVKLDKYMFKKVCIHQKEWFDRGFPIVPVSVNLSRKHLYNSKFIYEYKQMVDEIGIPIEYVQLEITESAIFDNQNQFLSIVDTLHNVGFQILMDDFGTGYSSLMMLKSIPIDILKLDKSFIDDYNDEKGEQIITYITRLAKAINISVTAEGVETEEQYNFLKNLGCDLIQGYYFAKPMSEKDFERELIKLMKSA